MNLTVRELDLRVYIASEVYVVCCLQVGEDGYRGENIIYHDEIPHPRQLVHAQGAIGVIYKGKIASDCHQGIETYMNVGIGMDICTLPDGCCVEIKSV